MSMPVEQVLAAVLLAQIAHVSTLVDHAGQAYLGKTQHGTTAKGLPNCSAKSTMLSVA